MIAALLGICAAGISVNPIQRARAEKKRTHLTERAITNIKPRLINLDLALSGNQVTLEEFHKIAFDFKSTFQANSNALPQKDLDRYPIVLRHLNTAEDGIAFLQRYPGLHFSDSNSFIFTELSDAELASAGRTNQDDYRREGDLNVRMAVKIHLNHLSAEVSQWVESWQSASPKP